MRVIGYRLRVIGVLLLCSISTFAWTYDSEDATTANVAQLRFGATFTKKWNNGLQLGVSEDLWFDVYNSMVGANFRKSYTTLDLGYKPIPYLKFDLGYTLKLLGPDSTWSESKKADANEWVRHRAFFSVTGSYTFDYAKVYLRERIQMDARTDSVNALEQNQIDWFLRSRVGTEFLIPGKPIEQSRFLLPFHVRLRSGHQYHKEKRIYSTDGRNAVYAYRRSKV